MFRSVFAKKCAIRRTFRNLAKKYVDKNWEPVKTENIIRFDLVNLPNFSEATEIFRGVENYGDLCVLSEEEKEQMKSLWEELAV